jgi:hypothetical protein
MAEAGAIYRVTKAGKMGGRKKDGKKILCHGRETSQISITAGLPECFQQNTWQTSALSCVSKQIHGKKMTGQKARKNWQKEKLSKKSWKNWWELFLPCAR